MNAGLKLWLLDPNRTPLEWMLPTALEIGRQRLGEPEPYSLVPAIGESAARLIVARQTDSNVSPQHLLLQPLPEGLVRVSNRSQLPLPRAEGGPAVPAGAVVELAPPFEFALEGRTIRVVTADSVDEHGVQGLAEQTLAPGKLDDLSRHLRPLPDLSQAQLDNLVGWLQTTMAVLQSTLGSADFREQAAAALVQIVGLDSGRVLVLEGDRWSTAAVNQRSGKSDDSWRPSQHVLERVRAERRTFWQLPRDPSRLGTPSLAGLQKVVAAPILNSEGRVLGALYGERRREGSGLAGRATKVEALLVELLACGLSTGLARQREEKAAQQAQVQFEQFFGPELARQLKQEPDLLAGRQAEVTLLFADIRGFSRISERLGPSRTVEWINEVLGGLSACVRAQEGVLVDYIGDELVAMWGAPRPHDDQAVRAVAAALAMLRAVDDFNRDGAARLGEPMSLGIGLNAGSAHVGNIGSRYKFKYGPLGHTVNLASRVEGVTKYLKCRLLATAATWQRVRHDPRFLGRRVCKARVVNIEAPVDLYEIEESGSAERRQLFVGTETALDALESKAFSQAAWQVGNLLKADEGDGPLLLTLARAVEALRNEGTAFDPVWTPPGK
jgi:adenylate cyclase